jgi:TRAP-type transport system periplasmic protein
VLVINADVFAGLTEDQRSVLRQAAAETRDWATANRTPDLDSAAEFCADGGTIVLASDADLTALEEAAQPVYEELEAEPQAKAHIEAIRQLKQSLPRTTYP